MAGGAENLNFSGSYRATVTVYLALNFVICCGLHSSGMLHIVEW
jgi:hypothetical protein